MPIRVLFVQHNSGALKFAKKMVHFRPLFLYFRLFNTVDSKSSIFFCRWLDSNCGPLGLEATALPTVPQPLPNSKISLWHRLPAYLRLPLGLSHPILRLKIFFLKFDKSWSFVEMHLVAVTFLSITLTQTISCWILWGSKLSFVAVDRDVDSKTRGSWFRSSNLCWSDHIPAGTWYTINNFLTIFCQIVILLL